MKRRSSPDAEAIARWRCRSLGLSGGGFSSPEAVVGGLLAVQAENHHQASWAVATRTSGVTAADLAQLFDAGRILRTHVLRPTWHLVLPDDIRWLLDLTAPRIRRNIVQQQRELGLADRTLDAAAGVIVDGLSAGQHRTRSELSERLRDAGLPDAGRPLALALAHAELAALICSGEMRDGAHTYALLDARAPATDPLDVSEARARLVLRYFTGHGPATERDLAYWATMSLTDVRAGLVDVGDQLASFAGDDGRTYWYAPPLPDDRPPSPRAHLLQILDELHHGYQDSRDAIDVAGIVPPGRPTSMGMAVVDAQMVGDMRRTIGAAGVTFEIGPFRALGESEHDALESAAMRYGSFLGLDAAIAVS